MARVDPSSGGEAWARHSTTTRCFVAIFVSLGMITGKCDAFLHFHGVSFRFESRIWSTIVSSAETADQRGRQSYFLIPPTNVSSTTPSKRDWQQLCPPLWNPKQTKDSSLLWSCCDDAEQVSIELLRQLDPTIHNPKVAATIGQSLQQFRDFCTRKLLPVNTQNQGHGLTFKARIVATRGSSGTKCPQWHVDHVAVRWIQSFVGPGCEMVVGNIQQGVKWDLINGLNESDNNDNDNDDVVAMSVHDRNQVLVNDRVVEIYQAKEMEAALLIGNRWADYAKDSTLLPPVVHKSPTIPWGCERVLLTQDVLFDDD